MKGANTMTSVNGKMMMCCCMMNLCNLQIRSAHEKALRCCTESVCTHP